MHDRFYIVNYGCQMNVYDSRRIADAMKEAGFKQADNPKETEILIFYTCNVRENAARKTFSNIGLFVGEHTRVVAVGGCVAQDLREGTFKKSQHINIVFGPQTYHKLPNYVRAVLDNKEDKIVDVDFSKLEKFDCLPRREKSAFSEFVTIQEGCNNHCTYCAVPHSRGPEYSRPAGDILAEIRQLVARGALEITLLGQNVNSYSGEAPYITIGQSREKWNLARLLLEVAELDGIKRLRYTTSHPKDLSAELMHAHAAAPNLVPFVHLPAQAGSDRILKLMNRNHTAREYLDKLKRFRDICPDIQFSSDFIVGFPTEQEADFEDTIKLAREAKYTLSFSFKYSKRSGTPAAVMDGQVRDEDKRSRLARLQNVLFADQNACNEALVGKTQEILFERRGKKAKQYIGKNVYMQSVVAESEQDLIGSFADVHVVSASKNCVFGRILDVANARACN